MKPRWLIVRVGARSRRSYGKVGDYEQSSFISDLFSEIECTHYLIMIDVVLEFLQLGYEKWSPERRSPELERRKREGDNEWKPAVDEFNDRLKR